jgi:hypothetical protein
LGRVMGYWLLAIGFWLLERVPDQLSCGVL